MKDFIPVNRPTIEKDDIDAVVRTLQEGWISSEAKEVENFEKEFASICSRKFGVAVTNGTVALELALNSFDLKPGDEVILPSFCIISCLAAVLRAKASPVLVDIDPDTWNMSVEEVKKKITNKTRVIMPVHTYGLPVDIDPILESAQKNGILVLEDAAEVHGQEYKGKPCGSFGNTSTFSFYANKHITTGEGGMILTNDENLYERLKSLRNLCFKKERRFIHDELGFNARMSALQAAIGRSQLPRIKKIIEKKRLLAKRYHSNLSELKNITLPCDETSYSKNCYWVFGIVLNEEVTKDSMYVMKELEKKGVGTRPFFWPMHEQPIAKKLGLFTSERYPVSEMVARRGFYLPSGTGTTDEEVDRASEALITICKSL